jgi:hypothetical protein
MLRRPGFRGPLSPTPPPEHPGVTVLYLPVLETSGAKSRTVNPRSPISGGDTGGIRRFELDHPIAEGLG